jgi:pyruvate dehydrogenase E1 component beta subunit
MDSILASVAKTGRCVIVGEAPRAGSFGAEIGANLAEYGLLSLFAPIARVASYDVVVPLSRLEQAYMPDVDRILAAVRKCLAFG